MYSTIGFWFCYIKLLRKYLPVPKTNKNSCATITTPLKRKQYTPLNRYVYGYSYVLFKERWIKTTQRDKQKEIKERECFTSNSLDKGKKS